MKIVNQHNITIKNKILNEPFSMENCSNITLQNILVDLGFKSNLCFEILSCKNIQINLCSAKNGMTLNDDGGEAHGFIINKSSDIRLYKCISSVDKKNAMEDHFNSFYSSSVLFNKCQAIGPTRKTGTGFCVDKGSKNISIANCVGKKLNYVGITIADGIGHRIENTSISNPMYSGISISNEWYGGFIEVTLKGNTIVSSGQKIYIKKDPKVIVHYA